MTFISRSLSRSTQATRDALHGWVVSLRIGLILVISVLTGTAAANDFFTLQNVTLPEDGSASSTEFLTLGPVLENGGYIPEIIGSDVAYQVGLVGATSFDFSGLAEAPTNVDVLILGTQRLGNDNDEENVYIGQLAINLENNTYDGQVVLFDTPSDPIFSWANTPLGNAASASLEQSGVVNAAVLDITVARVGSSFTITHSGSATEPDQLAFQTHYKSYLVDSLRPVAASSAVISEGSASDEVRFEIDNNTDVITLKAGGGEASNRSTVESHAMVQMTLIRQDAGHFLASGVVQVADGIGDSRVTNWAFNHYPVPGDLNGGSGASSSQFIDDLISGSAAADFVVLGDTTGNQSAGGSLSADVDVTRLGPKLYFDGVGGLIVEQRPEFNTDWTVQWIAIEQSLQGAPSAKINDVNATIVDSADTVNNDLNLGGTSLTQRSATDPGHVRVEIPLGATVGQFRLADSTLSDVNENRFVLEFDIDFTTNTTSGASVGRRASSPDFVSWSAVPFGTKLVDGDGLAPGVSSNRTQLSEFVDKHVGGLTVDMLNNPDNDGKNYLLVRFDAPGNSFSYYELGGAFATWSTLESGLAIVSEGAVLTGGQAARQPDGSVIVPALDIAGGNITLVAPDNFNGEFTIAVSPANTASVVDQLTVTTVSNNSSDFDPDRDGVPDGALPEAMHHTVVLETESDPDGNTVREVLGTSVQSGVSSDSVAIGNGIAVTQVVQDGWSQANAGTGFWAYSLDGVTWAPLPAVSAGNALMLDNDDRLRYVPDASAALTAGVSVSASVTFHAWDGSAYAAGQLVDLAVPVASAYDTLFSVDNDVATVEIVGVNGVPVAVDDGPFTTDNLSDLMLAVLENDSDEDGNALIVSAVDGTAVMAGGVVAVTGGDVTLSADSRELQFQPTAGYTGSATFDYTVDDGLGGTDSASVTLDIVGDTDGDGVTDNLDAEPNNPCNPSNLIAACDSDNDGVPDGVEIAAGTDPTSDDSDGDGIPDAFEQGDADGDGIPDGAETDADNDGILDADEAGPDVSMPRDSDGDGVYDFADVDSDNDGLPDAVEQNLDADGDGRANYRDTDSDNDGLPDALENVVGGHTDSDGDGLSDWFDVDVTGGVDANGDGVDDKRLPVDTDLDGISDVHDIDSDNDGISDTLEAGLALNADADSDGILDAFDVDAVGGADANGDGVADAVTPANADGDLVANHRDLDADNDGLSDVIEAGGVDANSDGFIDDFATQQGSLNAPPDQDGDSLGDWLEVDSDGDGVFDIASSENATLDNNGDGLIDSVVDEDNDGLVDAVDTSPIFGLSPDSDGDGITDAQEGTGDTDGDGIPDALDTDSDNDGVPDAVEAGPFPNALQDTDGDGVIDILDLDSDNDGIDDALEGDADYDGNGIPDRLENAGDLETAVTGAGSLGPLALLAMGVWRRRHRLRNASVAVMCVTVSLGYGGAAQASDGCALTGQGDDNTSCWYAGVGLGVSKLAPEGETNNFVPNEDGSSDLAFQVIVGRSFGSTWFGELKWARLGGAEITHRNPAVADAFPDAAIGYDVPSAMVGYRWREGERLRPYAKLGVSTILNEAQDAPLSYEAQSDAQVAWGVGALYQREAGEVFLRGEGDWYDRDAWSITVSIGKPFGGPKTSRSADVQPVAADCRDIDAENEADCRPVEVVALAPDIEPTEEPRSEAPTDVVAVPQPVTVFFDTGDNTVKASGLARFASAVDAMRIAISRDSALMITVAGHTDGVGSDADNLRLSHARAYAVREALVKLGLPASRITTNGYGNNRPIAEEHDAESRQSNRRAEVRW